MENSPTVVRGAYCNFWTPSALFSMICDKKFMRNLSISNELGGERGKSEMTERESVSRDECFALLTKFTRNGDEVLSVRRSLCLHNSDLSRNLLSILVLTVLVERLSDKDLRVTRIRRLQWHYVDHAHTSRRRRLQNNLFLIADENGDITQHSKASNDGSSHLTEVYVM